MYQKVLVPLDDSDDSRSVVKALSGLVAEGGEAVLLHVIPPGKSRANYGIQVLGSQLEEGERERVMVDLTRISNELGEASIKSSCAVEVSKSVAECIVNYASKEGVDLIAMYTHGRTGLAKLLKGSVTENVKKRAAVEVLSYETSELAELSAK